MDGMLRHDRVNSKKESIGGKKEMQIRGPKRKVAVKAKAARASPANGADVFESFTAKAAEASSGRCDIEGEQGRNCNELRHKRRCPQVLEDTRVVELHPRAQGDGRAGDDVDGDAAGDNGPVAAAECLAPRGVERGREGEEAREDEGLAAGYAWRTGVEGGSGGGAGGRGGSGGSGKWALGGGGGDACETEGREESAARKERRLNEEYLQRKSVEGVSCKGSRGRVGVGLPGRRLWHWKGGERPGQG